MIAPEILTYYDPRDDQDIELGLPRQATSDEEMNYERTLVRKINGREITLQFELTVRDEIEKIVLIDPSSQQLVLNFSKEPANAEQPTFETGRILLNSTTPSLGDFVADDLHDQLHRFGVIVRERDTLHQSASS